MSATLMSHWELSSILLFSYDTSSGISVNLVSSRYLMHITCMCSFCNQSHSLWPLPWLLTQPQHLPWTWYNSDYLMVTELYQHMCNCFTSTSQGGFHAVVFHCIVKFLGIQLQLLNMWSILHCSINSMLYYYALVHMHWQSVHVSVYLCMKLFVYHSDFLLKNLPQANAQYRHSVTINASSLRFMNKGFVHC